MAQALSEAERLLLDTTDEAIKTATSVFSFNLELLGQRVRTVDRWQAAIQAHLYLDHILARMLVEAMANPDAINLKRMSFVQKLDLAEAMGLLAVDLVRPIKVLNGHRNNIAHELDGQVLNQHVIDLANAIPEPIRDAIHNRPTAPSEIAYGDLLHVLVIKADLERQRGAYHRLIGKKSEYRLRDVLHRVGR